MSRPIVGNFWIVACNLICWLFFAALVGGFLTFLHRKYCSVFVKAFEKAFWLPVRKRMSTFELRWLVLWCFMCLHFLNFLFKVLRELSNLQKLRVYPTEQLYLLLNSNSLLFVPPPTLCGVTFVFTFRHLWRPTEAFLIRPQCMQPTSLAFERNSLRISETTSVGYGIPTYLPFLP